MSSIKYIKNNSDGKIVVENLLLTSAVPCFYSVCSYDDTPPMTKAAGFLHVLVLLPDP